MRRTCRLADSITLHSFPQFLNLPESCREKGVIVQRHNGASLHSKLPQTALKSTPKSLDYTQIGTLPETWTPQIFDSEKFWGTAKVD